MTLEEKCESLAIAIDGAFEGGNCDAEAALDCFIGGVLNGLQSFEEEFPVGFREFGLSRGYSERTDPQRR
jgi:hypothetical protein